MRSTVLAGALLVASILVISAPLNSMVPAAGAGIMEPSIEYEISDGNFTFMFKGVDPSDVVEVTWNGKTLLADMWDLEVADIEQTNDGFVAHFNKQLLLDGPGIIEVVLSNGERLQKTVFSTSLPSLKWLAKSKSSCSEAPGIYNAIRCDSVKSDVGTPPYPCCDNNSNGKATDSSDGNCTWFAWYKAKKAKGWSVPGNWGAGSRWCANAAKTPGWKVSSVPAVDTIACSSSIGHVAWVVGVSSDKKTITVEEMNCKVPPYCAGTGWRKNSYKASSFQYISR